MPDSADPSHEASLVTSFLSDEPAAADALARHIAPAIRRAAASFLGPDASDLDDVVQDSCLAVLGYVRTQVGFRGSLLQFASTVARNRCRNILNWQRRHGYVELGTLQEWIASPERSPLDLLADQEVHDRLQRALDELPSDCRRLLRGFYLEHRTIEELRSTFGLSTVQGVYYRRTKCLEKAQDLLNRLLGRCSGDE